MSDLLPIQHDGSVAQTRHGRVLHAVDQSKPGPGDGFSPGLQRFYREARWLHYAVCGEMTAEILEGVTTVTCKDCIREIQRRETRA